MNIYLQKFILFMLTMLTSLSLYAANKLIVPIALTSVDNNGQNIGTVTIEESTCGVMLTPELHNLPPGVHGFHVHVNPSCADKGMAAGSHFDPANTEKHEGPYEHTGHQGDLPVLVVNQDGTATLPTLAPRFKLSELAGHALMIHAGGDNYADTPEKLGGGGARIACGVIKG